jgi:hypothetical protein
MKIRPVTAELFHDDKRTDMTKLTVAFRNLANVPKKGFTAVTLSGSGHSSKASFRDHRKETSSSKREMI